MIEQITQILTTQSGELLQALGQHLEISLLALLIAAVIGIPLAVILMTHQKLAEAMLQVTSVLQTIPSLALLGLLIPLVGIGTVPAVITLVLYALMPIFQNTYAGLSGIDPALKEAEVAFGLPRAKRLLRIELPLAMPLIISGLRIALVMIIGTATLAALIGAGGLGTFILVGIQSNNNALLLVGATLSAGLALVVSALIRWLGMLSFKKITLSLAIFVGLFGVIEGIVRFQTPQTEITIAGKLGSEPEILMNMYRDLILADRPQYKVSVKPNFGGTTFLFNALKADKIDIYPEFTGTVLQTLVKSPTKTNQNPVKTYRHAQQALQTQFNMAYLSPMHYQNGYDLAVSAVFAKKYNVRTISDLAALNRPFTAGFDPDFYHQKDGYQGLKQTYHLNLDAKIMEPSVRYKAIADGKVDVVDGYTTDAEVARYKLVVLEDDRHFFPPYQGAPIMKAEFAKKHPEVVKALNRLADKITENEMQQMNYQVQVKHRKARDVAHDYLIEKKLITK
ncbi:ABC transporter permease/substrate-binding protein [Latilactobacillus graminis]|nr:ABC transporter permease/substrate-binding protein [Latilactobacillus graminis]QFP80309.1 ABC transporter permease/substrate-binding protein [Latilactobacillus graminis]